MSLVLTKLFNKIIDTGKFPQVWSLSLLTPIYKSEDPTDCGNYKDICISSCLGKLFTSILQKRLNYILEINNLISVNHGSFRKGYRTTDHIFILKTLLNKYIYNCKKQFFVCFVDFRKAFDSVWRPALFLKLKAKGIKGKFYNLLQVIYSNTYYSCKNNSFYSKPFLVNQGFKQGDSLSPVLFIFFVDDICKHFKQNLSDPVQLEDIKFNHLLYADDLVLISESPDGLQHCLDGLQNYSSEWRLAVNCQKTKVIVFS